jgi:medium-chain acyl-[acyl-carrier-protein] hydrolase
MITKSSSSSWIDYLKPNPHAQLRLFCFPYAGGSASIFRTWVNDLPPDLEVCPVQLPGRENRLMEPPFTRLSSLVQVLAQALFPYLDIPFAFFGHSMGALIGFELARELRRQNRPGPRHLFVSAHRAPQIPPRRPPIHQLAEAAFKAELDGLHGTPQEVLQSAELMQLLLPLLRADFAVSETYIYSPEAPLNCSISAYGGLQDKEVSYHDLEKWRDQTHHSFTLRMLPGNHFFVHSAQALLLQAVFQDLTTLLHGLTEAKAYDNYEFFTGLSTSSRVMRKRAVH